MSPRSGRFISYEIPLVPPVHNNHLQEFWNFFDFKPSKVDGISALNSRRYSSEAFASKPWGVLPDFNAIKADEIVANAKALVQRLEKDLEALEATRPQDLNWDAVFGPLDNISLALELSWGPVNHLVGVRNSDALRAASAEALPIMVQFGLRISQSKPVYNAMKALREKESELDEVKKRILDKRIKSAELAGIALEGDQKKRFNEIAQRLSQLSKTFSDNVLDATKEWSLVIDPKANPQYKKIASDLPQSLLHYASATYNKTKDAAAPASTPTEGPWKVTLDGPSVVAFLENCSFTELREEVYVGFISRSSEGKFDNRDLILETLALRKESAAILGFQDYSEISLAEKMAKEAKEVYKLLEGLRMVAIGAAKKEHQELTKYAAKFQAHPLRHWDISYYAKRLQEELYNYKEEEVRKYLPFDKVAKGLFALVESLFGVRVAEVDDPSVPKWNDAVRFYLIYEDGKSRQPIAGFYLDPFARPEEKRSGAWMDACRSRVVEGNVVKQIPIAYLVCNGSPPTADIPSLMTFREVETLFHEFGHGLQHMLTRVNHLDVSGINGVEWDAVELPSQFMENWCYHKPTFLALTEHFETKAKLPDDIFERIARSRTYRAGSKMTRQLKFGLTDVDLHTKLKAEKPVWNDVWAIQKAVAQTTDVLPSHPKDYSLCTFSHIFAGGYACGYYSYKWAEVLSADAFYVFVDGGLNNKATMVNLGRRYRETILGLGGSQEPLQVYRAFKGSDPDPKSLLRQEGLL